jgi:hypothetical protein
MKTKDYIQPTMGVKPGLDFQILTRHSDLVTTLKEFMALPIQEPKRRINHEDVRKDR